MEAAIVEYWNRGIKNQNRQGPFSMCDFVFEHNYVVKIMRWEYLGRSVTYAFIQDARIERAFSAYPNLTVNYKIFQGIRAAKKYIEKNHPEAWREATHYDVPPAKELSVIRYKDYRTGLMETMAALYTIRTDDRGNRRKVWLVRTGDGGVRQILSYMVKWRKLTPASLAAVSQTSPKAELRRDDVFIKEFKLKNLKWS